MGDIDALTQHPQPVAPPQPVMQPQPVAPPQPVPQHQPIAQPPPLAVAAPQPELVQQLPVAIAAQSVAQPIAQPVGQLVAAQATVATTASYAYAEVPYEPPMSAEEALATAEREGLILPRAESKTGFRGVTHVTGKKARPYQAWVCRDGKLERLGRFATPEEAALCRARTPEGKKAAHRSARGGKSGPVPMTVEEAEAQAEAAEAQAEAEGLTLQRSENQTGYVGVYVNTSNKVKPFEARVRRGGQRVFIGHFATAEEAALEVARVVADEPEGKKKRAPPKKKQKIGPDGAVASIALADPAASLQAQQMVVQAQIVTDDPEFTSANVVPGVMA